MVDPAAQHSQAPERDLLFFLFGKAPYLLPVPSILWHSNLQVTLAMLFQACSLAATIAAKYRDLH